MAFGNTARFVFRLLQSSNRQGLLQRLQSTSSQTMPAHAESQLMHNASSGKAARPFSASAISSSQARTTGSGAESTSGQGLPTGGATAALDAATLGPDTTAGGAEFEGSAPLPERQSIWWRALKFGLGTAVTGGLAGVGYVTYAYDTDTLQKKLNEARQSFQPQASKPELQDEAVVEGPLGATVNLAANGLLDVAQAYLDSRVHLEEQMKGWHAPSSDRLLPDLQPEEQGIYTLVLDLNDTLVHMDWKRERGWRTFKRPGVDAFLEKMARNYEVVVFSDQLNMTVDPILDRLDRKGCVRYRLYRDATQYHRGQFLRDFTKLNRDPRKVLYLTGHPENCMQKENVLTIPAWNVADLNDTRLLDHIPFLEYVARHRPNDTRVVLGSYEGLDIPSEFRERSKEVLRRQQERKQQGLFRLVR